MWFFNILVLCAVLIVHGRNVKNDDEAELSWPDSYKFQALRIYLSSGFTEDYQMWRTSNKSRLDCNNGAVKSFVDVTSRFGVAHTIHPEADEDGDTKSVCSTIKGRLTNRIRLETILPNTSDFEKEGTEIIGDTETTKFVSMEIMENVQTKKTLWAFYKSDAKGWLPKKYEIEEFNTWVGSTDKHEVWEFDNVDTNVEDTYFNAEEYCEEGFKEISFKNDAVTKNLLFMDPENEKHVSHVFKSFKKTHKKKYDSEDEHKLRRSIFKNTMRLVSMVNRQNLGYKLAINQFADRTPGEMFKYTGLISRPEGEKGTIEFPYTPEKIKELADTLPEEYDTRLYGYVGTVKNQQECGSCWTFGTTAALEGAVARANGGKFVTLSNQAILDCAWPYGANGCNGGSDTAAYRWLIDNGIPTQAEYGDYKDKDGFCHIRNMTKLYTIKGYVDVAPNSVDALKLALINHGPLSVSVNVNPPFQSYAGGVFYDKSCDPKYLNHEVSLVGYGQADGETYWILKNSWGTEWGIDGYMHISARDNTCGVATEPSYAVI